MLPEHVKQQLLDRYDPDDIISILELDIEDLIDALEHLIMEDIGKFELD